MTMLGWQQVSLNRWILTGRSIYTSPKDQQIFRQCLSIAGQHKCIVCVVGHFYGSTTSPYCFRMLQRDLQIHRKRHVQSHHSITTDKIDTNVVPFSHHHRFWYRNFTYEVTGMCMVRLVQGTSQKNAPHFRPRTRTVYKPQRMKSSDQAAYMVWCSLLCVLKNCQPRTRECWQTRKSRDQAAYVVWCSLIGTAPKNAPHFWQRRTVYR